MFAFITPIGNQLNTVYFTCHMFFLFTDATVRKQAGHHNLAEGGRWMGNSLNAQPKSNKHMLRRGCRRSRWPRHEPTPMALRRFRVDPFGEISEGRTAETLEKDRESLVAFCDFPAEP